MSKQASRSGRILSWCRIAMDAGLGIMLLKFLVGLVIVLSLTGSLDSVLSSVQGFFSRSESRAEPRNPLPQKILAVDAKLAP